MLPLLTLSVLLAGIPLAFFKPFIGLIIYTWLQYYAPQNFIYGSAAGLQYSLFYGVAVIGGFLAFEGKKNKELTGIVTIFIMYILWCNLTTIFAQAPESVVMEKYERTMKVFVVSLLTCFFLSTRLRIEAFLAAFSLAVLGFALAGLVRTVSTGGGGYVVVGSGTAFISDRNVLAFAVLMVVPILVYFSKSSILLPNFKWLRWGCLAMIFPCVITMIGTQSRGGLVTAAAVGAMYLFYSKRRFTALAVGVVALAIGLAFAPEVWFERMRTITEYEGEGSAEGRIEAWTWAWNFALANPIFGGGFKASVLNVINAGQGFREMHSAWFEVLSEQSFIGLALYVAFGVACWRACGRVARLAADEPELAWAGDLARGLRIALVAYAAGSTFLSTASYSIVWDVGAAISGLLVVARREKRDLERDRAALTAPAQDPPTRSMPQLRDRAGAQRRRA